MKTIVLFLSTIFAIAIAVVLFTSCEDQPGVYKPKKKISKVFVREEGKSEYLKEEWEWNGEKVYSIAYYNEIGFKGKDIYMYDGDRVSKIVDDQEYHVEYFYNGKQFEKIKYYDPNGVLLLDIALEYNGKKVSKLIIQGYQNKLEQHTISMVERGFMGKLLSKEGMKIVAEKLANQSKEIFNVNLQYEGDNLISVNDGTWDDTYSDYDTHSNIWYNFFPFSYYRFISFNVFSKNNPGKFVTKSKFGVSTTTHSYTYDGDFPVRIQSYKVYDSNEDTYDYELMYTTRFEYK